MSITSSNSNIINWNDTVSFVPPIQSGQVIKVYDGDTITVASKLPYPESPLYRFRVRLCGIDCAEITSDDTDRKKCAEAAKQELTHLLLHKEVSLRNLQVEKYGRILADVYCGELFINEYLLKKGVAVSYDGKTKKTA
jgi:micrococcal nuclease